MLHACPLVLLFSGNTNDCPFAASLEYGLILIVQEGAIKAPRNSREMQDNCYLPVVAITVYFLSTFPHTGSYCSNNFTALYFAC